MHHNAQVYTPGETQEELGLESPHSAQNLQVLQTNPSSIKSDRRRIKWPAASMTSLWQQFDDDVNKILEGMAKGEADKKLQVMTTTIVSIAAERFGEEEKKSSRTSYSMNQRAVRIHNIRQEMKALKSQYKAAGEEERTGLAQLMCILRKNIRVLRRAEWHRRRRRERARKRAAFIANPFKFTKDLLGQKRSGKLASSQEDIDQHLKQTYSDPAREQELGECNTLIEPPEPDVQFDMSELQLAEVREVVRKARASSAPGPSGTSYKVYKNCPKLLLRLCKILRVFWRRGRIPDQWRVAEGVWIPKEENSTQLDQFSHHLPAVCGGKDFLQRCFQAAVYLPGKEHLHRYISPERRHFRNVRMSGAYRCGDTAYSGGQRKQRQFVSAVA